MKFGGAFSGGIRSLMFTETLHTDKIYRWNLHIHPPIALHLISYRIEFV